MDEAYWPCVHTGWLLEIYFLPVFVGTNWGMDGYDLVQTCKSQNTTLLNAFDNDQNKNAIFFSMPVRSLADIIKKRKAYYSEIAFTYPNDTNLEGLAVL